MAVAVTAVSGDVAADSQVLKAQQKEQEERRKAAKAKIEAQKVWYLWWTAANNTTGHDRFPGMQKRQAALEAKRLELVKKHRREQREKARKLEEAKRVAAGMWETFVGRTGTYIAVS